MSPPLIRALVSTRSARSGSTSVKPGRPPARDRCPPVSPSARRRRLPGHSPATPVGAAEGCRSRRTRGPATRGRAAAGARWRPCSRLARWPGRWDLACAPSRGLLELREHRPHVVEHQRRERLAARHHGDRPVRTAHEVHRAALHLGLELLGVLARRGGVEGLHQLPREVPESGGALVVGLARTGQLAGTVEHHRGPGVAGQLARPFGYRLGGGRRGICHPGQNSRVPLSRIAWMITVGICLIAALLVLLNGYSGYAGVLLAVGIAAAVNLF